MLSKRIATLSSKVKEIGQSQSSDSDLNSDFDEEGQLDEGVFLRKEMIKLQNDIGDRDSKILELQKYLEQHINEHQKLDLKYRATLSKGSSMLKIYTKNRLREVTEVDQDEFGKEEDYLSQKQLREIRMHKIYEEINELTKSSMRACQKRQSLQVPQMTNLFKDEQQSLNDIQSIKFMKYKATFGSTKRWVEELTKQCLQQQKPIEIKNKMWHQNYINPVHLFQVEIQKAFNLQYTNVSDRFLQSKSLKIYKRLTNAQKQNYNDLALKIRQQPDKKLDYEKEEDLLKYREQFNLLMDPELKKTIDDSKLNIDVFQIYETLFESMNEDDLQKQEIKKCQQCIESKSEIVFESNNKKLRQHLKQIHRLRSCKFCDDFFVHSVQLKKHKEKNHADHKYQCFQCKEEFEQKTALNIHQKQSQGKKCMFQCKGFGCISKFNTKSEFLQHVTHNHVNIKVELVRIKDGKFVKDLKDPKHQQQVYDLFKSKLPDIEKQEATSALESVRKETFVLIENDKVVAFLVWDKIKNEVFPHIIIDYMSSAMVDCGLGSRLIEELKEAGDDQRFCQIFVQAADTAKDFYQKLGFVPHDKDDKIYQQTVHMKEYENATLLSCTLWNFSRDIKLKWIVPQDCPDSKMGLKQAERIKKIFTPEFDLELRAKTAKRISGTKAMDITKAKESDQAGTPDSIFARFYERFGLLKKWMYDPCLHRDNFDSDIHFDAIFENWGQGLIFLNHAWSISKIFFLIMMRQFMRGASIICLVTAQSLRSKFLLKYVIKLCQVEILDPTQFIGIFDHELDRPIAALYLFQPELLNYIYQTKYKKLDKKQRERLRQEQRLLEKIEQERLMKELIRQKISRRVLRKSCSFSQELYTKLLRDVVIEERALFKYEFTVEAAYNNQIKV